MTTPVFALTFVESGRLWLLLGVAALGISFVVLQRRRATYAVRFTNLALLDSVAPKNPGYRRYVPAVLMLLALAGMVGAFAKPARDVRVPRERATIMMAIDTSLSMEATDVAPSRLEAAQNAAKQFVELLPPRLNVGLVTFNGTAVVKVAPTQDRDNVPVSTIAFGTADGVIDLPGQDGPIAVPVNPAALAKVANATHGTAFTAATGSELKQVYEDIGSSVGYTTELKDITGTFVGASLLVLFICAALSQLWFSRLP